jgi:hypothetical protein
MEKYPDSGYSIDSFRNCSNHRSEFGQRLGGKLMCIRGCKGFDWIQDRYVCMSRVRWPGKKSETIAAKQTAKVIAFPQRQQFALAA